MKKEARELSGFSALGRDGFLALDGPLLTRRNIQVLSQVSSVGASKTGREEFIYNINILHLPWEYVYEKKTIFCRKNLLKVNVYHFTYKKLITLEC